MQIVLKSWANTWGHITGVECRNAHDT
jgi:hypothetical protein